MLTEFEKNFLFLRREYLTLTVNGLTKSPNILHITKRDFFQLSFLYSDQYI